MKLKEIKKYEKIEGKIRERASEICDYIIKNKKGSQIRGSVDKFEIYDEKIIVTLYETWPYGGYDYHEVPIDLKLFTSDNWLELITKKISDENEAFEKSKAEQEERERARKIAEAEKILSELKNK